MLGQKGKSTTVGQIGFRIIVHFSASLGILACQVRAGYVSENNLNKSLRFIDSSLIRHLYALHEKAA
ncbi:hypothetical protein K439DRAFT_1633107 [Ramaria rubella]|nr:hypothetical protein K439DRAFT_1633107 [Ramaria rubella]